MIPLRPQVEVTATGAGSATINSGNGDQLSNSISGGSRATQYNAINQHIHAHADLDEDKLDAQFRETLSLTCPAVDRNNLIDVKEERVPDTCEWILTTDEYTTWLQEGTSQLLWVWGGPGKGKTMLSIFVSQELEKISKTTYFFCSADDKKRNNAIAVVRGLLWQLTGLYPQLTRMLRERLRTLSDSAFSSRETLWNEFKRLLDTIQSDRCYCIIDGLDECDEDSQQWLAKKLVALGTDDLTKGFKVLVVSRDLIHLRRSRQIKLDSDHSESVDRAVKTFIDVRTEALFHQISFNDKLQNEIRKKLFERAQGSFLWIGFVIIDILKQKTQSGVFRTLRELPAGLFPLYDRMLQNIDISQRTAGICILCCVATVCRPVTLGELIAMIKIWPQLELSVREENVEDLIADCYPLLQMTSQTVRLVHESVRDYTNHGVLSNGLGMVTEEMHLRIAQACIEALTQEAHGRSILVPYATSFWPQHARESGTFAKDLICHPSLFFSANDTSRAIWWQSYHRYRSYVLSKYDYLTPLSLACLLGIEPWANDILSKSCTRSLVAFSVELLVRILMFWTPVRVQDAQAMTALHFSAIGGWEAIVKLLLDHGAAIDAENWDGQTALHLAAVGGQEAVTRLLLDRHANIHAKDWKGMTALHLATTTGHGAMVKLLLQRGADVDYCNRDGETPLHCAAKVGNEAAVELLLNCEANPNATTDELQKRRTALHYAACGGSKTVRVVNMLLEQGAEVNARDSDGSTALHLAAKSWKLALQGLQDVPVSLSGRPLEGVPGQFASVMEPSIDVQSGRLTLELKRAIRGVWSAKSKTESPGIMTIICLLIEHQADVDIEDEWGETALAKVRTRSVKIRSSTPTSIVWSEDARGVWRENAPMVMSMLGGGAAI